MIKENICSYHEYIKERSRKIKKLDTTKITTLEEALKIIDQTKQYAAEIYEYGKKAKTAGQHMENRMRENREAIESLGYVRKKKYQRKRKGESN
jgi:hypothetical protein